MPVRNKDGDEQGRRINKPPAGPELRVQARGAPKEHAQPLPQSGDSRACCVQGVALYAARPLRGLQGGEH